jgi:hypothetical protein
MRCSGKAFRPKLPAAFAKPGEKVRLKIAVVFGGPRFVGQAPIDVIAVGMVRRCHKFFGGNERFRAHKKRLQLQVTNPGSRGEIGEGTSIPRSHLLQTPADAG